MAEPALTTASTSATATRIFILPPGSASATVSWSRSRESSLSIEAHSKLAEVANLAIARGGRGLNPAELAHGLGGEVGQQAAIDHHPAGDSLQYGTVLFAGRIHGPASRQGKWPKQSPFAPRNRALLSRSERRYSLIAAVYRHGTAFDNPGGGSGNNLASASDSGRNNFPLSL